MRVVKCMSDYDKACIFKAVVIEGKTKSSVAATYAVSPRTIGRVVTELVMRGSVVLPREVHDVTVNCHLSYAWDYCVTKDEITLFRGEEVRTISKTFPSFKKLKSALVSSNFSEEVMSDVFDQMCMKVAIEKFSEGNITVDYDAGKILYGTFEIKNSLVPHIFSMLEKKEDVTPMVRFLDKLMENPKQDIIDELYGFMKHNGIEIDNEGYILAYKGVRDDYNDVYSNTISHKVGSSPKVPRAQVVYDPNSACGAGLHGGSYEYARQWGARVMVVRIHPRDVVSVPYDCDGQKMRTCGYDVIAEVD